MNNISENSMVTINDKKIFVEYCNPYPEKPVIVFLHDSLGCAQLWRDFPEKLAQAVEMNVLIYDRVGYGKSERLLSSKRDKNYLEQEADFLEKLLSVLDIHKVILFGHSDGGSIALIYSGKYPEKVSGLICEAGHIFVEDVTLEGIYKSIDAYYTTNLPERLAKYHGEKVDTIFKAWTETWTSDDYRSWNIESFLPDIKAPLLFVQGDLDEYGTMKQVDKTISQVSGKAEKYIVTSVGHTPHKENPSLTLDGCISFLKSSF